MLNMMQLYTLHVVPVTIIFYGAFILFMHVPLKVIGATLAGGLTMALLNLLGDVIAIHTSLWYYSATGLLAQLPLPFYTVPLFITGGLAYLLIWRFWRGPSRWLAWILLVGVPILGFLRDLLQGTIDTQSSFLIWKSPIAWVADLILWGIMFYAGYAVYQRLAPARQVEVQQTEVSEEAPAAVDKQK